MASSPRGDLLARILGVVVFLVGIGIILFVLRLALGMFHSADLGFPPTAGAGAGPTATQVGVGFGRLLFRLGLLFLGSISGSLIASKGIHLYFSGLPDRAPRTPA